MLEDDPVCSCYQSSQLSEQFTSLYEKFAISILPVLARFQPSASTRRLRFLLTSRIILKRIELYTCAAEQFTAKDRASLKSATFYIIYAGI